MPSETGRTNPNWSWDTALCGVVPPMISPLNETGESDGDALKTLVGHILNGGCSGLFVLGGCGEGAWLTSAQRASMGRGQPCAGPGRRHAAGDRARDGCGAAGGRRERRRPRGGLAYYLGVDAATQQRHVEAILGAVSLPLLLYNIPQATHNPLAPATVARLAQNSRILGIKDSAGDFEAFQGFLAIKKHRAAFRVLQGNEYFASASLLLGGDGLVPGMANFAPDLFVELRRAAAQGDASACAKLQEQITDLCTLHTHGHWLPALKAACAMLGLGNGVPSLPLLPATDEQRRAIEAILARHGFPGLLGSRRP